MDDRCPDVLAVKGQGPVRLAAQLGVERGVVQRIGEFGRQAGLIQDGLEEGPDAAGLIAARVQAVLGDVDIVINNAATVTPVGPTASIDPDQWTRAPAVNVAGPMRLTRALLDGMVKRPDLRAARDRGRIAVQVDVLLPPDHPGFLGAHASHQAHHDAGMHQRS